MWLLLAFTAFWDIYPKRVKMKNGVQKEGKLTHFIKTSSFFSPINEKQRKSLYELMMIHEETRLRTTTAEEQEKKEQYMGMN